MEEKEIIEEATPTVMSPMQKTFLELLQTIPFRDQHFPAGEIARLTYNSHLKKLPHYFLQKVTEQMKEIYEQSSIEPFFSGELSEQLKKIISFYQSIKEVAVAFATNNPDIKKSYKTLDNNKVGEQFAKDICISLTHTLILTYCHSSVILRIDFSTITCYATAYRDTLKQEQPSLKILNQSLAASKALRIKASGGKVQARDLEYNELIKACEKKKNSLEVVLQQLIFLDQGYNPKLMIERLNSEETDKLFDQLSSNSQQDTLYNGFKEACSAFVENYDKLYEPIKNVLDLESLRKITLEEIRASINMLRSNMRKIIIAVETKITHNEAHQKKMGEANKKQTQIKLGTAKEEIDEKFLEIFSRLYGKHNKLNVIKTELAAQLEKLDTMHNTLKPHTSHQEKEESKEKVHLQETQQGRKSSSTGRQNIFETQGSIPECPTQEGWHEVTTTRQPPGNNAKNQSRVSGSMSSWIGKGPKKTDRGTPEEEKTSLEPSP